MSSPLITLPLYFIPKLFCHLLLLSLSLLFLVPIPLLHADNLLQLVSLSLRALAVDYHAKGLWLISFTFELCSSRFEHFDHCMSMSRLTFEFGDLGSADVDAFLEDFHVVVWFHAG